MPTAGSRAATGDGTNHSDSDSQRGETSGTGGGITVGNPDGGHVRDKEIPCHTEPQEKGNNTTGNAARCSSCSAETISAGAPGTGILGGDTHAPSRRGDAGTTGLSHAGTASAHGDGVADSGGEKAGMSTSKQNQKENSFVGEDGVGAELGFTGARPCEPHAGFLLDAHAGATANDIRHDEGSCALGVAGAVGHAGTGTVRKYSPTQAPTHAAPDVRGDDRGCGATADAGDTSAASAPEHTCIGDTTTGNTVGASYGVPDGGFSPIVYVDYNYQERDWFEVYGPDFTDDEGELLPDVAAAARHSIPAGGGVVPVSPGSFLQVMDVVKWWLGVDVTMSTDALGTLRHAMKGNPR